MSNTLTIRADCSSTIGTGHVMRMIALAQAWQAIDGKVCFIGDVAPLATRLRKEGFSTLPMTASPPDGGDINTLINATKPGDWIAIDGYHFDTNYQRAIRNAGRKTLVLDDVCDRNPYNADILLNQNPDAGKYSYSINEDATQLLGARYALLRKEFTQHQDERRCIPDKASNILVTLGGADHANMTPKALDAIATMGDDTLHIKIVAGPANPHLDELRKKVNTLSCSCELLTAVNDMPSLMRWADLAISAAGSTCWELCFFGVPMLTFVIADNQQGIGRELAARELAVCLDTTASVEDIAAGLHRLCTDATARKAMSTKGKTLIDGRGATRVAQTIYCSSIRLRRARQEDCETLHDWRNDPLVRLNSFNTEAIPLSEHRKWYEGKINEDTCLFFVGEDGDGSPVGQIRFDRHAGEATVSVSVAPTKTGRGIGTTIVQLGCMELRKTWPGVSIIALVKKDNPASATMFEKAGFIETTMATDDHLRFVWSNSSND